MAALKDMPDERGFFGRFGGRYLPETLMSALEELTREYAAAKSDRRFQEQLNDLLVFHQQVMPVARLRLNDR